MRKPIPLERFPPELLEAWKRALLSPPLHIACGPVRATATKLRHQLYSLRKSLAFYGNPLGTDLQSLTIMILHSASTGFYLTIDRSEIELSTLLRNNGILPEEAPSLISILEDDPNPYTKIKK